jgi:hypothetical protein
LFLSVLPLFCLETNFTYLSDILSNDVTYLIDCFTHLLSHPLFETMNKLYFWSDNATVFRSPIWTYYLHSSTHSYQPRAVVQSFFVPKHGKSPCDALFSLIARRLTREREAGDVSSLEELLRRFSLWRSISRKEGPPTDNLFFRCCVFLSLFIFQFHFPRYYRTPEPRRYAGAKFEHKSRYLSFQRGEDGHLEAAVLHGHESDYVIRCPVTIEARECAVTCPQSQTRTREKEAKSPPFSARMAEELLKQASEMKRKRGDVTRTPERRYPVTSYAADGTGGEEEEEDVEERR